RSEGGESGGPDLDLPGLHLGVHVGSPAGDLAPDADAPLQPEAPRQLVRLGVDVRLEDHLGQPVAIAEIDEHCAAVVAAILDPAEEDHRLSDIPGGELAAGVRALDLGDEGGGHEAAEPNTEATRLASFEPARR